MNTTRKGLFHSSLARSCKPNAGIPAEGTLACVIEKIEQDGSLWSLLAATPLKGPVGFSDGVSRLCLGSVCLCKGLMFGGKQNASFSWISFREVAGTGGSALAVGD